jgi:hypothetical protein
MLDMDCVKGADFAQFVDNVAIVVRVAIQRTIEFMLVMEALDVVQMAKFTRPNLTAEFILESSSSYRVNRHIVIHKVKVGANLAENEIVHYLVYEEAE